MSQVYLIIAKCFFMRIQIKYLDDFKKPILVCF